MEKYTKSQKQLNLYEKICKLPDRRRAQGRMHPLPMIIMITIMAIMSGITTQRGFGDFAKRQKKELVKLFALRKKRVPTRKTIGRALGNLDFMDLSEIFRLWAKESVGTKNGDWISLDGKAIRGTVMDYDSSFQNFVSLVSAFCQKKKQVLGAGKIESKKESEIPTVRELIKLLDLEGVVFTIDALHCTKETTKTIIESGNDYVIATKENQKKLYEQIKKTQK